MTYQAITRRASRVVRTTTAGNRSVRGAAMNASPSQIMSERTTINVAKDAHRKASEAKKEDESWSDYIQRCADTNPNGLDVDALEQAMNQISMENTPGVELDTEEVLREVGKAVELAEQARDNTDEIKRKLK